MDIAHQVGCILVYDQACMDRECLNETCGESITVGWSNTILNYALVVANAVVALSLMRAINTSVEQHGVVAIPSHLASCGCFSFGKWTLPRYVFLFSQALTS